MNEYDEILDDIDEYGEDETPITPWVQFLREKHICGPDYEGNMPCDNGAICDKCGAPWIQEAYEIWLEGKAEEQVSTL